MNRYRKKWTQCETCEKDRVRRGEVPGVGKLNRVKGKSGMEDFMRGKRWK